MATREHDPRELPVDQLADRTDAPIQVLPFTALAVGDGAGDRVRDPHRHDYHELAWVRSGCGRHSIDGESVEVAPNTVTLIGRGQVHVFEGASELDGAVIRFDDDVLGDSEGRLANPAWLLSARGGRTVSVPPGEVPALESTIATLAAEANRPGDGCTLDLQRHLLHVLLIWLQRWYDDSHTETHEPGFPEMQMLRRFTDVLERDFATHHDAGHYADALAVPAPALSRALAEATGKTTKELILDRVMTEAARLLRFTDLTIGQVADRVGFTDPLYFSRAFKRERGEPPQHFRERGAGTTVGS
jgi:AraC family transcriptional activator of pobA